MLLVKGKTAPRRKCPKCNQKRGRKIVIEYKRKCDECGKFFLRSKLVKCFGKMKCEGCASIKNVPYNKLFNIPSFLLKQYDIHPGDKVKLTKHPEGILIKKVVENNGI